MSTEDKHPAQGDEVPSVFPVTFFKEGEANLYTRDFRPSVVPSSAPEDETPPKAESAPEPAEPSVSEIPIAETVPESPAQTPAVKVTGPAKVPSPGKPAS